MYTEKNTLRETVDRGNSLIPLYLYHHYSDKYMLYLHWHNELEIIYVEKGSLIFTVDTIPLKVSQGQCIIISSGQLHSANFINNEVSIHHALLFDLSFLSSASIDYCQKNYISPLINGQYRFPLVIDETSNWGSDVIKEVKEGIKICDKKEFGWEMGIKACLYKMIYIIAKEDKFNIDEAAASSSISYKIKVIKKSLNYIHENYTNKIYIEDLAKEVNMNPQYFCRFFKTNVGKTPVEFINEFRIEEASKIIKTEDKKISDVCYEVGFDNFSYFIKKFKEYKNCTPNKYRCRHIEGSLS